MAKPVIVRLPHELGRAGARTRIAEGFESVRNALAGGGIALIALDEHWEGDRFHFQARALGRTIKGHLDVREEDVLVEILLPNLLATLAGRISKRVRHEGVLLLEKK